MRTLAATLTLTLFAATAIAQVEIPRVSPRASVIQVVGTTEIRIDYHRPGVKGRGVWGGLVPLGQVWRLGANDATKLTASDPFSVGGTAVPAGSYALFAIPGESSWTFILNAEADQWGAFEYDQTKDIARVSALTRPAPFHEWLTFTLTPTGPDTVDVTAIWGHVAVSFPIRVAVSSLVWNQLTEALRATPNDPQLNARAARFATQTGERLEQGLSYIDRAQRARPSFWNLDVRANLLWPLGREAEAIETMERALRDAEGKAPDEFFRTRGATLAEWKARAGGALEK